MKEADRERSVGDIEDEKSKSFGPSEVSCEMFLNDVSVRAVWSGEWPFDDRE